MEMKRPTQLELQKSSARARFFLRDSSAAGLEVSEMWAQKYFGWMARCSSYAIKVRQLKKEQIKAKLTGENFAAVGFDSLVQERTEAAEAGRIYQGVVMSRVCQGFGGFLADFEQVVT